MHCEASITMLKVDFPKRLKKAAQLRLRLSEVEVFLEITLTALRGFNRNAEVELS